MSPEKPIDIGLMKRLFGSEYGIEQAPEKAKTKIILEVGGEGIH